MYQAGYSKKEIPMNKSVLRTFATLGLSALLVPLASAQSSIDVTVPFDFTVASSTLPAGEYRILQVVPSVLQIQRFDGKSSIMTGTLPVESNKRPGDSRLTFNRYGDHYFLAGVSGSDHVSFTIRGRWRSADRVAPGSASSDSVSRGPFFGMVNTYPANPLVS
jgi:hypothetical protein